MIRTSDFLKRGGLYSRSQLSDAFAVHDATLQTGIFRPVNHSSIWIFITKEKTPDRIQYVDDLSETTLHMESQKTGRKDRLLVGHVQMGLEIVLFYRIHRREHVGGAFRYEGLLDYVSNSPSSPSHFVFSRRSELLVSKVQLR
jgi:putative restriction endonuclease